MEVYGVMRRCAKSCLRRDDGVRSLSALYHSSESSSEAESRIVRGTRKSTLVTRWKHDSLAKRKEERMLAPKGYQIVALIYAE